jgi:hypothetical protein
MERQISGFVTALLLAVSVCAVTALTGPAPAVWAEEPTTVADVPEAVAEEPVLNVTVPVAVDIMIDPFEIADRGQVYSDAYEIRNHGDTDVILTFTDFEVIFANDAEFKALAAPFDEASESDLKAIYLLLNFGRADIPPVVMTGDGIGPVSVPLAAAGEGVSDESAALSLRFSGGVNPYPGNEWQSSDVKIRLTYRLETVPAPPEDAETLPDEEEPIAPEEEISPEENPISGPEELTPPDEPASDEPEQNTSGAAITLPEKDPAT